MSYQRAPRKPVVTAREGIKVRVMADMIPLTAEEHGQKSAHGFRPVTITDRDGFQRVRAGWELTDRKTHGINVSAPTEGAALQEVMERVTGGWVNYEGHKVRTVSMGDLPLGGLPRPKPDDHPSAKEERKLRAAARSASRADKREDQSQRTGMSDAYLRAVIQAQTGRVYAGPIDRKMRAMILDVISNQESVRRYTEGK